MSADEPTRRTIVIEVLCYAALVLAFGGAFVAWRVAREGQRVLMPNPHAHPRTPAEAVAPEPVQPR